MKHRLKGLLALVLSLMMVLGLMTCAWAATATSVEIGNSVTLGSANPYWKNDGTTASANDYNAYFDAATGILTLKNFVYEGTYGINADGNLAINLIGSNTVADTASATSGRAAVVVMMGDLTITSENNGSLNASSDNNNGISANNITIDGANVSVGCNIGLNATGGIINIMRNSTVEIDADGKAIDCTTLNLNDDINIGGSLWYQWETASSKATATGTMNQTTLTYNNESYLKLEPLTYTVTFDANSHGTAPSAQSSIAAGGKVTEPTPPTENGWRFDGWYKEQNCTTKWDFNTDTVTADITLYAKWTENSTGGPGSYWSGPNTISPDDSDKSATKTESPKTFDGGIASAVVVTILSATGGAWLAKKKD